MPLFTQVDLLGRQRWTEGFFATALQIRVWITR